MESPEDDDVEDGEIKDGFLGQAEMESRKTLANAYGEDVEMSWVEAVLLGAKHVAPGDSTEAADPAAVTEVCPAACDTADVVRSYKSLLAFSLPAVTGTFGT